MATEPAYNIQPCDHSMQSQSSYQVLKRQPKSELHLHLENAWPEKFLIETANTLQASLLQDFIGQIKNSKMPRLEIVAKFLALVEQIVTTNRQVEDGVALLCDQLAADKITYVEIRTELKELDSTREDYLNAVLRGINRGTQNNKNLKVNLILGLRRYSSIKTTKETVDLAINNCVVGLDLSGDVTKGDIQNILPELLRAKQNHIPIILHIGVDKKELSQTLNVEGVEKSQQLFELESLQPKRICHATHLIVDAKQWVLAHTIPIEVCPSRAIMTGMISSYDQHPAFDLYRNGHPCIICTGDTLSVITDLSQELAIISECLKRNPAEFAEHQRQLAEQHRLK